MCKTSAIDESSKADKNGRAITMLNINQQENRMKILCIAVGILNRNIPLYILFLAPNCHKFFYDNYYRLVLTKRGESVQLILCSMFCSIVCSFLYNIWYFIIFFRSKIIALLSDHYCQHHLWTAFCPNSNFIDAYLFVYDSISIEYKFRFIHSHIHSAYSRKMKVLLLSCCSLGITAQLCLDYFMFNCCYYLIHSLRCKFSLQLWKTIQTSSASFWFLTKSHIGTILCCLQK